MNTEDSLPVYFTHWLPNGQLARLTPLQQWALSHLEFIHTFWTLLYISVLVYIANRHVLLPLLTKALASRTSRRA